MNSDKKHQDNCVLCGELIALNAKKCPICQSYQNRWVRWSGHAGIILAIISICIIGFEAMNKFKKKSADIKAIVIDPATNESQSDIKFMVSNIGDAPAAINEISIAYKSSKGNRGTAYVDTNIEKMILNPEESQIIIANDAYHIPDPIDRVRQAAYIERYGSIEKDCSLVVSYFQIDNVRQDKYFPFPCVINKPSILNQPQSGK